MYQQKKNVNVLNKIPVATEKEAQRKLNNIDIPKVVPRFDKRKMGNKEREMGQVRLCHGQYVASYKCVKERYKKGYIDSRDKLLFADFK